MSVAVGLVKKSVLKFLRTMKNFCDDKGIEFSLRSFLFHKSQEGQYLPDSYRLLLSDFPIIFLSNSKTFDEFYYSLDNDMRRDIIKDDTIKKARAIVITDKHLNGFLKGILKDDYIYKR